LKKAYLTPKRRQPSKGLIGQLNSGGLEEGLIARQKGGSLKKGSLAC